VNPAVTRLSSESAPLNTQTYAFAPDWFARGGYIRKDFDKPGLEWSFLEGTATDFAIFLETEPSR